MFQGALAFEDQLAPRLAEHLIEVYGGGGQGKARCHGATVPAGAIWELDATQSVCLPHILLYFTQISFRLSNKITLPCFTLLVSTNIGSTFG